MNHTLANRASRAVEELVALRTLFGRLPYHPKYGDLTEWSQVDGDAFAAGTTRDAEPYWWEPLVCDVVEQAVNALPAWTVRRELFPTPSGFFMFARALSLPVGPTSSGGEAHAPLQALSWSGADSERVVFLGWKPLGEAIHGVSLTPSRGGLFRLGVEVGGPNGQSYLRKGSDEIEITEGVHVRTRHILRILGACLLFLEQRIVVSDRERPDRAARRRFDRAELEYPDIRVVRLRRSEAIHAPVGVGRPVDWRFRWMVRGHWRQQWYPSDSSHRPQWIAPYVKGPPDRPVKEPKSAVFAVVR